MKQLLEKLTQADGISGYEDEVKGIIKKELGKYGEVMVDKFGNVVCTKGSGSPKIMLAAHMDEIGLLVKHIDDNGFIRFIEIGGVDDETLPATRVKILTEKGPISGTIGFKPPHLKKDDESKKKIKSDDMYIDTGLGKEEVKKRIQIGDPVLFETPFTDLGDNVLAKALDNRAGCAVLIDIMKQLKDFKGTVYAVATVQEELGLKGARTSAFNLKPDYALALDTGIAGDVPDINDTESSLKLGEGPAITVVEAGGRGMVPSAVVKKHLIRCARDSKIPYQLEATKGGMTDGAIIYMSNEGVMTGGISIPTRYIHSPSSICSEKDMRNAAKLTVEFIKRLGEIS
jgi:endoglucanase